MDINQLALEITRLKARAEIHELILLKSRLLLQMSIAGKSLQESQDQVLLELEEIAAVLEKTLFSSSTFVKYADSEKALYADEFREIVEHMKSSLVSLASRV